MSLPRHRSLEEWDGDAVASALKDLQTSGFGDAVAKVHKATAEWHDRTDECAAGEAHNQPSLSLPQGKKVASLPIAQGKNSKLSLSKEGDPARLAGALLPVPELGESMLFGKKADDTVSKELAAAVSIAMQHDKAGRSATAPKAQLNELVRSKELEKRELRSERHTKKQIKATVGEGILNEERTPPPFDPAKFRLLFPDADLSLIETPLLLPLHDSAIFAQLPPLLLDVPQPKSLPVHSTPSGASEIPLPHMTEDEQKAERAEDQFIASFQVPKAMPAEALLTLMEVPCLDLFQDAQSTQSETDAICRNLCRPMHVFPDNPDAVADFRAVLLPSKKMSDALADWRSGRSDNDVLREIADPGEAGLDAEARTHSFHQGPDEIQPLMLAPSLIEMSEIWLPVTDSLNFCNHESLRSATTMEHESLERQLAKCTNVGPAKVLADDFNINGMVKGVDLCPTSVGTSSLEDELATELKKELLPCPSIEYVSRLKCLMQADDDIADDDDPCSHFCPSSATKCLDDSADVHLGFLQKLVKERDEIDHLATSLQELHDGEAPNELPKPLPFDTGHSSLAVKNATEMGVSEEDATYKEGREHHESNSDVETVKVNNSEATDLDLDDELDAFMHSRGHGGLDKNRFQSLLSSSASSRQVACGTNQKLDASIKKLLGKPGVNTVAIKLSHDSPIALAAFILRCLSCAVMIELVERGIVRQSNVIHASVDEALILKIAGQIRSDLLEQKSTSWKIKARTTAAWSALMLIYLLNKIHAHLIHSGTAVAGLFVETALADPMWNSLCKSVAPDVFHAEVVNRLVEMRKSNEQHPKLAQLRSIVAERALSLEASGSGNSQTLLTVVLVKSTVSFADVSKAIYGLNVVVESRGAADLAKRCSFTQPQPGAAVVWLMTEQAMLLLLEKSPPAWMLDDSLVVFLTTPGPGMNILLKSEVEPSIFKKTLILETTQPFIEENFLLSGAKSYSGKVEVQIPLEGLWVDVEEDAAANIFLHRSVKICVYVNQVMMQRRDLVQSLLEENVHLLDRSLPGCDIVASRFMCMVVRPLHQLYDCDSLEGGFNHLVTEMVELGRAFERVVLLIEMVGPTDSDNAGRLPRGLDAKSWIKLTSIFQCCGVAVTVRQVLSVDELALAMRMSIEEDCGLHDPLQRHLQQRQHNVGFTCLEALQEWNECHEEEPSPEHDWLTIWPSLNPCSADHVLAALHTAGLAVDQLLNINSEQQVLDVVHDALERAGLPSRIFAGLRMTAEAATEDLLREQELVLQEQEQHQDENAFQQHQDEDAFLHDAAWGGPPVHVRRGPHGAKTKFSFDPHEPKRPVFNFIREEKEIGEDRSRHHPHQKSNQVPLKQQQQQHYQRGRFMDLEEELVGNNEQSPALAAAPYLSENESWNGEALHVGASVLLNKQTGRLERGPTVFAPQRAIQDSPLHHHSGKRFVREGSGSVRTGRKVAKKGADDSGGGRGIRSYFSNGANGDEGCGKEGVSYRPRDDPRVTVFNARQFNQNASAFEEEMQSFEGHDQGFQDDDRYRPPDAITDLSQPFPGSHCQFLKPRGTGNLQPGPAVDSHLPTGSIPAGARPPPANAFPVGWGQGTSWTRANMSYHEAPVKPRKKGRWS